MFHSRAPRQIPAVDTMLDDLSYFRPGVPAKLARHLGVAESTLKTYARQADAPRSVQLALFWETQWGLSTLDVQLFNDARMARQEAQGLKDHQARLAGIIWRMEMQWDRDHWRTTGQPANLPLWRWG